MRRRHVSSLMLGALLATSCTSTSAEPRPGASELAPSESDLPETGAHNVEPATNQLLSGDELLQALSGRTWVALERHDHTNPTVLTHVFSLVNGSESPAVRGHDGCNHYESGASVDGVILTMHDAQRSARTCESNVLKWRERSRIEMRPDATTFLLTSEGGAIARFTDLDSLEPATESDLWLDWVVDGLDVVEFSPGGRGNAGFCVPLAWNAQDGSIVVTLDTRVDLCAELQTSPVGPISQEIGDLASGTNGAGLFRTDRGMLLSDGLVAIELRRLETAPIASDRATVAAGALFGIHPQVGVSPEDVMRAIEPHLGPADHDSGWLDRRNADLSTTPIQSCGLNDYRELMWGDLVTTFWQSGSRTVFLSWHVGDDRIPDLNKPEADRPPPTGPSGVVTEHGVEVGDPAARIPDEFNLVRHEWEIVDAENVTVELVRAASRHPAANSSNLEPKFVGGQYLIIDGVIAAFGSNLPIC